MTTTHRLRRTPARALVLATALTAFAGAAHADTLTITHPPVPTPTLVDVGEAGESPGDVRIFHFGAETADGTDVVVDWVMTTTAIDAPETGVDSRLNYGVFSVGDTTNQIVLHGVALYPRAGATLKAASTAVRVVTGGSGRFAGARGWVESTHHDDDTWTHVFHLDD